MLWVAKIGTAKENLIIKRITESGNTVRFYRVAICTKIDAKWMPREIIYQRYFL